MQILRFSEYNINEFNKFGTFPGSVQYTDWSGFKTKLLAAIKQGFKDEADLCKQMGLEKEQYDKIADNMILNWKDSVSKSLLHGTAEVGNKLPKKGDNIFKDTLQQTQFLILAGPGLQGRNMMGDDNMTKGLRIIDRFALAKIKDAKGEPKTIGGVYAMTVAPHVKEKTLDQINEIMQYVWLYVFFHHYKVKKDPKVAKKMPKYLYRGIRGLFGSKQTIQDLFKGLNSDSRPDGKYSKKADIDNTKARYDKVIEYIIGHGINKIADGKLLSFTAAKPIADYFANKEGMILRIDPSKVNIVSSELTEPKFAEKDYVSGKKEREYIVRIPHNYKFSKEDIEIVNAEYLMSESNPLVVAQFSHDDVAATYELGGYSIRAKWYWKNNGKGSIVFTAEKDGHDVFYSEGRVTAKKELGFDPMPTEDNLKDIKNFKLKYKKDSYNNKWEDL